MQYLACKYCTKQRRFFSKQCYWGSCNLHLGGISPTREASFDDLRDSPSSTPGTKLRQYILIFVSNCATIR